MLRRRLACLAPLMIGAVAYAFLGHPALPIGQFELAGNAADAADVVAGRVADFKDALQADWFAFIPGYTLTILLSCLRLQNRGLAAVGCALGLAAAACDVLENLNLWDGLVNASNDAYANGAAFAIAKFALVLPALVIAIVALVRPARTA